MSQLRLSLPFLFMLIIPGAVSTTFTMSNECGYTVWAGILSNAGVAALDPTGFSLQQGESRAVTAPSSWAGRMWGRTYCSSDSTGKFSCVTGDCGSGTMECSGNGATPPATLAEFTLDGYGGQDFFDVSLVDGYNLPMLVTPQGGTGPNCTETGCAVDLNGECPAELEVMGEDGGRVACRSACEAFQQPEYCCSGEYASPATCKPSSYSQIFKKACPTAYSYAYDDGSSTFTCSSSPDYLITFCPSPNTSQKASQGQTTTSQGTGTTGTGTTGGGSNGNSANSTMVYEGALNQSNGASSPPTCSHVLLLLVGVAAMIWQLSLAF